MKYGVIGEHLEHSFSKEIHSALGNYEYEIKEIEPRNLDLFFEKRDFIGINVTIPYKQTVMRYLDEISQNAKKIGAVNTIINKDGVLFGYNTDYFGMKCLIEKTKAEISDKKVLILGTGGTSKTAYAVVSDMGARSVFRVSRTGKENTVSYGEATSGHNDADIIINTTPCGMYPDNYNSPIDLSYFRKLSTVIDAVYNPIRTELVLSARERGIKAEGGLYMLSAQAALASELFGRAKADRETVDAVYNSVLKSKENIVLTGMPGCGKTTVGYELSKRTGRVQIDTDKEIVRRTGMDIKEFFNRHGEKAFRDIEEEVIKEVSENNFCIISTGGGSILRKENINNLKQNGRIFYINRSLNNLIPTEDRPKTSTAELLEKVYKERRYLYESSADTVINGDLDTHKIASIIEEMTR